MCLILDANLVHQIFPNPTRDFEPIYKAVMKAKASIVYGGYITEEYFRVYSFLKTLRILDSQGKARHVSDERVAARTGELLRSGLCSSDDPHILALAQISGARLLCSNDNSLVADFTNRRILKNPRGKVYRRPSHRDLISSCCSRHAQKRNTH